MRARDEGGMRTRINVTRPVGRVSRDNEARPRSRAHLRCRACGHAVAEERFRIIVDGGHEHAVTNPHGYRFHIGCFDSAPGCTGLGERLEDYTWFPGFAWRVAVCVRCRDHLGWSYRNDLGEEFFGLILARLDSDH